MKKAVFPGSFDPITIGHVDIVKRGIKVFDEIIIAVGDNTDKKYMFPKEKRVEFVKQTFNNYDNISIETRVNGEIRQNDNISNMIFKFPYLLSYLSTFFDLKPGDIIATGTPVGAGARFDPPIWLKPGDIIEIHVPSIGTLKNSVEDESVMV